MPKDELLVLSRFSQRASATPTSSEEVFFVAPELSSSARQVAVESLPPG